MKYDYKYIRAKNGIYEIKSNMIFNHIKEYVLGNTIEELCDEFVLVEEMREATYYHRSHNFNDFKSIAMLNERYTLYGAIWTSKGLIYVAQMNNKGELELI